MSDPRFAAPDGFLDAASGQPMRPAGRDALLAALDAGWADPARLYRDARRARALLDAARESVAARIGARPDEVSFTASGTEAIHRGVEGLLRGRIRAGRRLVVSAVEHSAVLRAADVHAAAGGEVATVGVDRLGRVDADAFVDACGEGTAAACLQQANHEVGTTQPVAEVGGLLGERGVPLLVDAGQAVGRVPVAAGWSALTASARLWGGPPGVGVLAVRTGVRWRADGTADEREGGRVPGFAPVPLIVAAAAALEDVDRDRDAESARLSALVDRLRSAVPAAIDDVDLLGDPVHRLPHLVTFSVLYADGESLVLALDREGLAVTSGSACVSDTRRPSHVLAAMGALTQGNLRVSLPHGCPVETVDRLIHVLPRVVAEVRASIDPGGVP
ncbi:MAG: aminotransferase class V-fold PLP-dependent enzyme [Candidatus Nanopelagicales bacterium]